MNPARTWVLTFAAGFAVIAVLLVITLFTPVFRGARLIGYLGSTIHHTDISGYGIGAGARDVHEEAQKAFERGERELA